MKIKKIACLLMAFAMIWITASCRINNGSVTELTDLPGTQQTNPPDPGSDGPSKPVDPSTPSEPEVSAPTEPEITEPSEPTEPADPITPTEPVHEHSYSEEVTEATCTQDGYTTYSCECGDSYVDGCIEATGHKFGKWVTTKEPTEVATGTAERTCSDCGERENKVLDKVIPDHTHSYTGKVTAAATCSKEGVRTYTCSCGSSYTERIAKTSHSYKVTVVQPTCTAKGYTTHKCSACGDSYKDSYVAVTGHKYGTYTSNGDATCTADGTKTATCSACGSKDTKTDAGTAKGHSYTTTVTAPTCSEQGYTTHKCSICGDSYKDSYVPVTAHDYIVTAIEEATMWWEGYTTYTCNHCGQSYESDRIEKIPQQEFERMVAEAVVKYINQFRQEQGDTEAISLPGLTLVAEYRSVQLCDNFEHSTAKLREAHAYFQYGEYHDMTQYGYDESKNYWSSNCKEAIAARGNWHNTPEIIGEAIARQFLNSANHWAYVGSSDYPYIGVGIAYYEGSWKVNEGYAPSGFNWHCCVLQTRKNYG